MPYLPKPKVVPDGPRQGSGIPVPWASTGPGGAPLAQGQQQGQGRSKSLGRDNYFPWDQAPKKGSASGSASGSGDTGAGDLSEPLLSDETLQRSAGASSSLRSTLGEASLTDWLAPPAPPGTAPAPPSATAGPPAPTPPTPAALEAGISAGAGPGAPGSSSRRSGRAGALSPPLVPLPEGKAHDPEGVRVLARSGAGAVSGRKRGAKVTVAEAEGGGYLASGAAQWARMTEEGSVHIRRLLERKRSFIKEVHVQSSMAWPMMISTFLQLLMTMSSLAFVGRLGETALASASIATAFANVVGHIVLQGLASSLETLCGQAYGAGVPTLLGLYLQRGLLCLGAVAVPLGLCWWEAEHVLLFFQQDPTIAAGAALYLRFLLPSLGANVVMQCMERFLQAQGVTLPMALAAAAAISVHIPLTWLLVFHLQLGFIGAPIAISLSFCANLTLLMLYTVFSGVAKESWDGFTWQAFYGWGEFMSLAIPSTFMLCLEYWGFELLTLMAGLLPNPGLEVSAFQVILNIDFLSYVFPYGFGAAVSIRVSNELGAGRPEKALGAARVGILFAVVEVALLDFGLFLVRRGWGMAFTSAPPVIAYVTQFVPVALVAILMDSMIGVLSGVVRGCGFQHHAVVANLISYYLIGVPLAMLLGFYCDLRAWGLFLGLVVGMTVQVLCLLAIVLTIDWDHASDSAKERLEEALLASDEWDKAQESSSEEEDEEEEGEEEEEGRQRNSAGPSPDATQESRVTVVC